MSFPGASSFLATLLVLSTAATAQPANPDVYPREDRPVTLKIGPRTVSVRPIKKAKSPSGRDVVADRIIVAFHPTVSGAGLTEAHRTAARAGAGAARPVLTIGNNTYLVDVSGAASLERALRAYRADPRVRFAGADYIGKADETPNDTNFNLQWGMTTIDAPTAWNRTHGMNGPFPRRIAILDSGINVLGNDAHADLAGKVIASRDFTESPVGADDLLGHGTHVAGIAAAVTNNDQGVAGVGYDARLLNAKVLDDNDDSPSSALASGLYWAADQGADVINMSLGHSGDCDPNIFEDIFDAGLNEIRDALNYAWDRRIVIVASAGNLGDSAQRWPASCPHVVAVANTTQSGGLASSSTRGDWVELAAPGSGIQSTAVMGAPKCGSSGNQTYANCSGTSMAAPHVAGLAALVQASCLLDIQPQAVIDRMTSTAVATLGTRFGRIDASRAVCFPVPTGLRTGTITSSSIQVVWSDPTPGEQRFEVAHRLVGGNFLISNVSANITSFTQSNLTPGSRHEYKVRACDNEGCSAWSNTIPAVVGGGTLQVALTGAAVVHSNPAGISCGLHFNKCLAAFPAGSVKLTANDHEDESDGKRWDFHHWEGDCSGTSRTCTLSMTGARSVKAVYTEHDLPGPGGHR